MLQHTAKEVHIIHRRTEFRAHTHSVNTLTESDVNIHTPFVPERADIDANNVAKSITIKKVKADEEVTIDVDDIICNYGFISNLGPIKEWGLELNGNKIVVDSRQQTSIEGIFAIGDICTYPGKAALIINGFGEAPIAINSAFLAINPEAVIGVLHSSSVIGGH